MRKIGAMDFSSLKAQDIPGLVKSGEIRKGAVYDRDPDAMHGREPETQEWARAWTALMQIAAGNPDPDAFTTLVGCGFDPLETSPSGVTCLMVSAACNPELGMAKACLESGAPVSARDRHGIAALHLAALNGSPAHVELLTGWGEDLDCTSIKEETPLMLSAIRRDGGEMTRHLVGLGAEVDAADAKGVTSLMFSLRAGNLDTAKFLIGAGASTTAKDSDGRGPLEHYVLYMIRENVMPDETMLKVLRDGTAAPGTMRSDSIH